MTIIISTAILAGLGFQTAWVGYCLFQNWQCDRKIAHIEKLDQLNALYYGTHDYEELEEYQGLYTNDQ